MSENFKRDGDSIRIEQIDAKIKKAFADVAVSPGLEARILAAVAEATGGAAFLSGSDGNIAAQAGSDDNTAGQAGSATHEIALSRPRRRWYATHWYLAASSIFVAASLLLALFIQWNAAPAPSESLLVQTAMDAFDSHGPGRALGKQWPAEARDFRPSADVALSSCTAVRWQPLDDFLGSRGVLYAFTAPNGAAAELYVLKSPGRIKGLTSTPPWTPQRNTGGRRASAWQADGFLYVLVVHGNTDTYRRLLSPGGPLT